MIAEPKPKEQMQMKRPPVIYRPDTRDLRTPEQKAADARPLTKTRAARNAALALIVAKRAAERAAANG